VTYKTGINEPYEWDDVATWAGNYQFEALTAKGANIMKKLWGKDEVKKFTDLGEEGTFVDNVDIGEATSWVDDVKKAGGKMELEHADDYGNTRPVYESINKKGVKLTAKEEFLNASGIDSGYGLYDDSIDEVYDIIHGIGPEDPELLIKVLPDLKLKGPRYKSEGGAVGLPPIILNEQPKEIPDMVGPPYETNNPNEAIKEILRRSAGSGVTGIPIGGDVSLNFPYGTNREYDVGIGYNTSSGDGISGGYAVNVGGDDIMGAAYNSPDDSFNIGVRKQEGSDPQWNFQKKWKFAKGGKAWRPKSAPKLTTTIPPERGPTPHGLTYLTGDDIVKHRIG
jgi:hypothetical protein